MSSLIEYTEQLIQKLETVLAGFRTGSPAELESTFSRWQDQLAQMRAYAQANQTVSIAFVGGTGAGKSTLINSLLGADLLPTHSFRTCTSAAISVGHAARKTFQAKIEFLPETAWETEKQQFLTEIKQTADSGHASFVHQDFLYKAWALYRPRKGQPPLPFPLDDLLKLLEEPLPESLQQQLEAGELLLKDKTAAGLKAELSRFLTAESPIWPLIRQVRISGPFPALQDGLELVDLPGLNDPNPVRETITRRYLKSAEFLWLIFGTGRGLTREVMDLMKDQSFLNQIVLDGKVSALAFIGTRADDFVPELERRALGLPEEAGPNQILLARADAIRQQIQQQLSELTLWFSNRYKLSAQAGDVIELIARTLQQSPVQLTSALSWQADAGWLQLAHSRFVDAEHSGIPELQQYMQQIVSEHGVKARKKLIRSQFQQMNQEIRRLIEALRHRQQLRQPDATLAVRLAQLQQEQLAALNTADQELSQQLQLKLLQFEKQLAYAFADLPNRLENLLNRWSELNWQHLQRAVRNHGLYSSPRTGQRIDLTQDVLHLIEAEVALDWYAFFQHRLLKEVDAAQAEISGLFEQSCDKARQLASGTESREPIERLREQGLAIFQEQSFRSRRELESLLRDLQRQIGHLLNHLLSQELVPVFTAAGDCSGSGVKASMLDCLQTGLHQALPQLGHRFGPELRTLLAQLTAGVDKHRFALGRILREQLELLAP